MEDAETVLMSAESISQHITWVMARFWLPAPPCANAPSCECLDRMAELAVWVPGLTGRQPSLAQMSQNSSSSSEKWASNLKNIDKRPQSQVMKHVWHLCMSKTAIRIINKATYCEHTKKLCMKYNALKLRGIVYLKTLEKCIYLNSDMRLIN